MRNQHHRERGLGPGPEARRLAQKGRVAKALHSARYDAVALAKLLGPLSVMRGTARQSNRVARRAWSEVLLG